MKDILKKRFLKLRAIIVAADAVFITINCNKDGIG